MKTFYFNIQAKGGAGKSMLTYLQALKNEENESTLFVDLDNSTKTSIKQLKFLKDKKRLVETDIIDAFRRIEREKLFRGWRIYPKWNLTNISWILGRRKASSFQTSLASISQ